MNKLDILAKCITLLYRENELGDIGNDNSKDLVRTILNKFKKVSKPIMGGRSDIIEDLCNLGYDMINNPLGYDKLNLIQSLELILNDYTSILSTIKNAIEIEMTPGGLKRSIVSLRANLNNYYKETEIADLIKQASLQINLGKLNEGLIEYTSKLITNLEALTNVTKGKDPGIVDEIDLQDNETMDKVLKKIKTQAVGDGRFKSGWKELNDMLGGGFRPGETVLTSALQHQYKSGFIQSLFCQLCMFNRPILKDKSKRPLNLFISLEDDSDIILNFMYRYLYFSENETLPNITDVDTDIISRYIYERLTKTGFHVKVLRVNPSDWTYKHLVNKILEYEASGYEINILMVDYLSKLPTTGCVTSGPIGTDLRDMLNRVRNVCSARGILFITPHQISTEAKQLLRNGIRGTEFVKEIANKGYYEGSKQLDQIVDLEIHQHIAKIGKKFYLTFQRGKRRYPEIIDEDKKYFMLPFPHKAPIPPNLTLDGEYTGFKYAPEDNALHKLEETENEFNF